MIEKYLTVFKILNSIASNYFVLGTFSVLAFKIFPAHRWHELATSIHDHLKKKTVIIYRSHK